MDRRTFFSNCFKAAVAMLTPAAVLVGAPMPTMPIPYGIDYWTVKKTPLVWVPKLEDDTATPVYETRVCRFPTKWF